MKNRHSTLLGSCRMYTAVLSSENFQHTMVAPDTIAPIAAVCQLKNWKEGRKLGALPIFSANVARFVTRKVIKYYDVVSRLILRDARYALHLNNTALKNQPASLSSSRNSYTEL